MVLYMLERERKNPWFSNIYLSVSRIDKFVQERIEL